MIKSPGRRSQRMKPFLLLLRVHDGFLASLYFIFLHIINFLDILAWNVYRIGNESSIRAVNNLVHWHKLLILVLIEPKVSGDRASKQSYKYGLLKQYLVEA